MMLWEIADRQIVNSVLALHQYREKVASISRKRWNKGSTQHFNVVDTRLGREAL